MKYIKRHLEDQVMEISKSWAVILLTGPRQAGKTTMLRELAKRENIGREYVSLDDLNVRELAKTDPELAQSEWIFPTPELLAQAQVFRDFTADEEREYTAAFGRVIQS